MIEIMLDIETLSTANNAVIMTIGAIKFNRNKTLKKLEDYETFYRRIDMNSCLDIGLDIDSDTLSWWDQQDEKSKIEIFDVNNRININQALEEFSEFYKGSRRVWSNGDDFDCVILSEAFKRCNMQIPWHFWETRDCRTIMDLGNVYLKNINYKGKEHHALHDCYKQLIALYKSLENLKLN